MKSSILKALTGIRLRSIRHVRTSILVLAGTALAATLISCSTVKRTIMAPPQIPGATVVGNDGCAQCHDKIVKDFKTASHAKLRANGDNSKNMGCESCHGGGSVHVEAGGGKGNIINPKREAAGCFQCHLDKRGQFALPNHHPVENGKVSCGDCHDPHKGDVVRGGAGHLESQNETCFKCHDAQRGPFVFEHEASREGCTTCHNPHGSVNEKMLVSRNTSLCLKCHFQQQTGAGVLIGGIVHTTLLRQGTCWTAGCHEAVHGSQVHSSLRY